MKYSGVGMILIGILIIAFPEIIAYIIGAIFVFIGVSTFIFANKFGKTKTGSGDNYVKFGNYKIYR